MSVDVMRWVDRWFGIPLCAILTVIDYLSGKKQRDRGKVEKPQRIIFICLAEIGAMVVAYPAMRRVIDHYPDARTHFLTFSSGKEMLHLVGFHDPDQKLLIRTNSLINFITDTIKAVIKMRRLGIDTTVNLEVYSRYSTALAYASGAARRSGFYPFDVGGAYVGNLVTHRVVYNPHIHASEAYLALVEALTDTPSREPAFRRALDTERLETLHIDSNEEQRAAILAKVEAEGLSFEPGTKLILINPNSSDLIPTRRWPVERFVQLAKRFLENDSVLVVLTGSPRERKSIAALIRQLPADRVANLAGKTTIRELIDLYNVGSLLITNDSGPGHFVSVTDLPAIVLYGPETPRIFGPIRPGIEAIHLGLACSPCISVYNQKKSACTDNQCLKQISVDRVYEKALNLLASGDHLATARSR